MRFELLGPSGAGKTFFLKNFMKSFEFILFSSMLTISDIDLLISKSSIDSDVIALNDNIEKFTGFCVNVINKSLMSQIQKENALKIFNRTINKYEKIRKLEEYGYIIMDDEFFLHRAFAFLAYSCDFENDVRQFFELVPTPDIACLCTAPSNLIKERLLKKPALPNSYLEANDEKMDLLINKSLEICAIAKPILLNRGVNVISLDLSQNIEYNTNKLKPILNEKINEYKNSLRLQILNASGSFAKRGSRHFLKNQNVIYCSFSTPNFVVSKKEAQRNSEERFERFGLNKKVLKGKTVLDLGSNCGAMLFQASNYGIKKGLGFEYDLDKVILSNKIAALSKLDYINFKHGNIDEISEKDTGIFDIVFALAIEAHVNDCEHLLKLLSKITKETLYFEGNSNCDIQYIQKRLKELGFNKIDYIGFCNDDIVSQNNNRPMLKACKTKK